MVANKERAIKRKASEGGAKPEPITSKQEPLDESNDEDNSNESDYESDKENLLGSIENEGEDSSDSDGEYATDDDEDDVLSFESLNSDGEEEDEEEDAGTTLEEVEREAEEDDDEEDGEDDEEADSADDVNSDSSPEEDEGDLEDSSDDELEEEEEEEEEAKENGKEKPAKAKAERKQREEQFESDDEPLPDDLKLGRIEDVLGTGEKKTRGLGVFPPVPKRKGKAAQDEYAAGDTSDEEDIRNTVGNIPMHWYDEYKHVGYDWDAKKIIKAKKGDAIDDFLQRMEDPNFWRTVTDPQTGQKVVLSDEDIGLIKRIMSGRNPDAEYDDYEPFIEWFTSEVEKMPIRNIPESKRSFLPSKAEKHKIGRYVHALKMGWMKTMAEKRRLEAIRRQPKFYMLWTTDHGKEEMRRIHDHVAAPKRMLPGHAESYNPPPEYLFDEKELEEWNKLANQPWKRKRAYVPQKYNSLREVPGYTRYVKERFLRCLDLYLAPRMRRSRVAVGAEYLIPKLPSPRDLQPFPTLQNLIYTGHTSLIRCISVEPKGEYIVTGSDDMTVKIWEISTARCIRTIPTGDIVRSVAWCPNSKISLVAAASGKRVLLINPKVGDYMLVKKTDDLLTEAPRSDTVDSERIRSAVQWGEVTEEEKKLGVRIVITHFREVRQVTWHGRGDYFATVMPDGAYRSVMIHQLSKRRSQVPFSKSKGLIQCVLFHPIKPCLFVATQRHIRVYDLVKQLMMKKLYPGCKWISSMAIHPKGDNLLIGTYEKRLMWFDLDLSTKPYQQLRIHNAAIRSVAFHPRYPLFASAGDDRSVIVSHGMVYNDLLQNPLIVPLRRLKNHAVVNDFSVFDVVFHPTQPWVFSSGADNTVRLYT
ncbi:ribosome biogenesis protein BOP1 homolog [Anopheles gambiae]|uniref:ribosome biogenesis protein BOP1 homolog n=1 Tax=Anopheles coluzzii TaxID=1518534 RepID=UPI0020FFB57E|nr:ribosome biogenesis protein BOP1 homolog [Anopheles coluzzii]XP_308633.5 ribosome biogenesis protein BOP1 homolog [Anopheles gambiae]